jgi:hypothetical protein
MNRVFNIRGEFKPPLNYYTNPSSNRSARRKKRASNARNTKRLTNANRANRAAIAEEEILRQLIAVADSSKENLGKRVVASSAAALMTESSIKRAKDAIERDKDKFHSRFFSNRPPTSEEIEAFEKQMKKREKVPLALKKSTNRQKKLTLSKIANYYRHGSENVDVMVEEQARKASNARATANRLRENANYARTIKRNWRNINLQEEPFFKAFEQVILAVSTAMDNADLIRRNTTTPTKITDALAKKDAEHASKMAALLVKEAKELFKADRSPATFHKLKWAENIQNEISAASRAISKLDAWSNLLIMFLKMGNKTL